MRRSRFVLAAAAAAALAAASAALGAGTAAPTLNGTVGPGFTISLTQHGKKVTMLRPGTYRFVVADRSTIHNFVVEREKGGHFEKAITTPGFQGTKTVTITLGKGQWKYYCAPHESTMHGFFTVR